MSKTFIGTLKSNALPASEGYRVYRRAVFQGRQGYMVKAPGSRAPSWVPATERVTFVADGGAK